MALYFRRSLDNFENAYVSCLNSVNAELGNGEVFIKIPQEALGVVAGYHSVTFSILLERC